jgi:hypothetical protein
MKRRSSPVWLSPCFAGFPVVARNLLFFEAVPSISLDIRSKLTAKLLAIRLSRRRLQPS